MHFGTVTRRSPLRFFSGNVDFKGGAFMKFLIVRIAGAVAAATVSMGVFGSGVASADPYAGQTYADAKATIAQYHQTPVIATVSGDRLATDDCIVVSSSKSSFLDSSGGTRGNEVLINLNCNEGVAAPGKPGNSAMSPAGQAAKKEQKAATNISKDPSYCQQSDEVLAWCHELCTKTGLCEV
ncbi:MULTISPECIES: hypothetical protein [unclassified Mycobacterium]|uniref:hypothetical protein n=1 Tax=unclassified Mycobacterium TaxID=2642494 RepID=UPI0029C7EBE7|nr:MULTISPECIES: hypothetical protein [unclassified Mycobacterium]